MAFGTVGSVSSPGSAGGLSGAAEVTYEQLEEKYLDFLHPRAQIFFGDQAFTSFGKDIIINDIRIELTSGYEASVASFCLYNSYDSNASKFKFEQIKKHVVMGNSVTIQLGYVGGLETVFVGFVTGVAFGYRVGKMAYIEVTAMDIKGVMMGGAYATSLKATTYSAAVKEVLDRTGEGRLQQMGGITAPPKITNTPDVSASGAPGRGSSKSNPITVEMVNESDYEFVVRAAKRYNYEFFVDRGQVLFRPAKSDTSLLIKLGSDIGLRNFRVEYSITGVVGEIEARAMDPGNGKVITAKSKFNNKISTSSKAKQLMGKGAKVYVDASISSKEEAESRVNSLMEKMSYRLGSLDADCVGMPELVPGRFVEIGGMGTPADNQFYLTSVVHNFSSDGGFITQIKGCTSQVRTTPLNSGAIAGGVSGSAAASKMDEKLEMAQIVEKAAAISQVAESAAGGALGAAGMAGGLTGGLSGMAGGLTDSLSGMAGGLTDGITGGLTDSLSGMAGGLTDGITGGLTDSLSGIAGGLTDSLSGMAGGLTDGITGGLTDSLSGMAEKAKDTASEIAGKAEDAASEIAAKAEDISSES